MPPSSGPNNKPTKREVLTTVTTWSIIFSLRNKTVQSLLEIKNFKNEQLFAVKEESDIPSCISKLRRSQRSRGLRDEPSSPARTLGLLVRIPFEAWMSVCVYSVFVLFCV
jgi:hypothetical protein